jgi:hypothetical protein
MERTLRRFRVVSVTVLVVLSLTAFAGSVSAAPGPTPNGFTGACNMVMSWPGVRVGNGVGVQPGGGMENAMTVNNPNGNAGMNRAVDVSGGYCP